MGLLELLLLSAGLAMDAFAVSVCKGLSQKKVTLKAMLVCGIWFGIFQALMPAAGYLLGVQLSGYVTEITPWIAFALLAVIGGNMVREALSEETESEINASLCAKVMFAMAVATSIDALAVGVTFACVPVKVFAKAGRTVNTLFGVGCIGIITFLISCIGVKIGGVFGSKYEKKAELAGGIILVCLGLKILIEHLIL
ncbi:MAG: manganese efflux pump MntP family protein [Eubacteriales bacterium]|nr:manganese efflux pump MntP family protein [Eubacteriales bacterium]